MWCTISHWLRQVVLFLVTHVLIHQLLFGAIRQTIQLSFQLVFNKFNIFYLNMLFNKFVASAFYFYILYFNYILDSNSKYYQSINGTVFTINSLSSNDSYFFACYSTLRGQFIQATFVIDYLIRKLLYYYFCY